MIYVKANKKNIVEIDDQIKNNVLDLGDYGIKFLRLKALKKLTNNTLQKTNLNIDIYIDLRPTGANPLGFFSRRARAASYGRDPFEINPFLVIFPCRIFRSRGGRAYNFKKVLLHELVHYKEYLQIKDSSFLINNRHHNRQLPSTLGKNKLVVLENLLHIKG